LRTSVFVMIAIYALVMLMLWFPEIISFGDDFGLIVLGFYKYLLAKTANSTIALVICGGISGLLTMLTAMMFIISKKIEELEEVVETYEEEEYYYEEEPMEEEEYYYEEEKEEGEEEYYEEYEEEYYYEYE